MSEPAASPNSELLSCVLPTAGRYDFLALAIQHFLRQTYRNSELVVVHDGPDPHRAQELCAGSERIRLLELGEKTVLGRKENLGLEHARGEIICKWDDDDYYHPEFLQTAVRALGTSDEPRLVAWQYYPVLLRGAGALRVSGLHYVLPFAGATLCFRRRLWQKTPFREVTMGQDWWFSQDTRATHIYVLRPDLYIYIRHGANAWQTQDQHHIDTFLRAQRTYPVPLRELVVPECLDFYQSLLDGTELAPAAAQEPRKLVSPAPDPTAAAPPPSSGLPETARIEVSEIPLVSCLMPTFERPGFLQQAIRLFLQQDYPRLELIVVDDSPASAAELIPISERIRYFRIQPRASLGAKLNLALEQCSGEIVAHWDDDDWYAPGRISYQVNALLQEKAELCCIHPERVYDASTGKFWTCAPECYQSWLAYGGVIGATMVYPRRLYEEGIRHPDFSLSEDDEFARRMIEHGGKLITPPAHRLFVYIRHPRTTAPGFKNFDSAFWRREDMPDFFDDDDRRFYAELPGQLNPPRVEAGRRPAPPPHRSALPVRRSAGRPARFPGVGCGPPRVRRRLL
jgi:glycosyltransferase involved in cell wall biosynthesis